MDTVRFDQQDFEANRTLGALGYLIFLIPMIACPKSQFGKFCANQGLLLWIVYFVVWLAFWLLGLMLGWVGFFHGLFNILQILCNIAIGLTALFGFIKALNNEAFRVPFIGGTELYK